MVRHVGCLLYRLHGRPALKLLLYIVTRKEEQGLLSSRPSQGENVLHIHGMKVDEVIFAGSGGREHVAAIKVLSVARQLRRDQILWSGSY